MKKLLENLRPRLSNKTGFTFWKPGLVVFVVAGASFASVNFVIPELTSIDYEAEVSMVGAGAGSSEERKEPPVVHLKTPDQVMAIYMSQCVVGTPWFRDELVSLIEETELNSVVIDIKDFSGKVSFPAKNPILKDSVSKTCGAHDMKDFLRALHDKNVYIIGRVTVFQDPYYTSVHPEFAVKRLSASTTPWKDHKGLNFIDVGARPFWDYIVAIAEESYEIGFDEINFDYIRFPSDGNMQDVFYSWSNNKPKQVALEEFFKYLAEKLVKEGGPIISADLFGMTTTNSDDLNIGQVLERALPYFDYVAPMVYPSHYPPNFNGWANPNHYPYEVIHYSMSRAVERVSLATTTINIRTGEPVSKEQLRPWLQDFDYGGNYGPEEVRAQIKATYDAGLDSWMLWAPSNRYTREALENN